jgi:lipoyl(octanoyl) transferase
VFRREENVLAMSTASWELQFLDTGAGPSAFNMALDEALLEAMPRLNHPVLRFYGWTEPAASFGYFQRYSEVQRLTPLRPLVRRPTGGGIVPHDADWTYSLIWPASHPWYSLAAIESYRRVHEWIQAAFVKLDLPTDLALQAVKTGPGQCFAGFERFDLLYRGRKIAGAAQRRTRQGLLIQGSVQPPSTATSRAGWQSAMLYVAENGQGAHCRQFVIDKTLQARASELTEQKYTQPSYNQRR